MDVIIAKGSIWDKICMISRKVFIIFLLFLQNLLHAQTSLNSDLEKASWPSQFKPEKIRELIEKGADVNHVNKWGNTPLIMAVIFKDIPLIKFLIEKGADSSFKNKKGLSALDFAERSNDENLKRALQGIDTFDEKKKDESHTKLKANQMKTIATKSYSNARSKIDSNRPERENLKEVTKREGVSLKRLLSNAEFNPQKIKQAINQGADIETKDSKGETAAFWAVKKKNTVLFEWLVRKGAVLNHKNNAGQSIKDLAIKAKWYKIKKWVNFYLRFRFLQSTQKKFYSPEDIRKFVQIGVPVDDRNLDGETPLTSSLKLKDKKTFNFLLDNKADPNIPNAQGMTPLKMIKKGSFTDLLDKTSQMAKNSNLRRYLKVVKFNEDEIKKAIQEGADINTVDALGNSALIIAVIKKNTSLIDYLIEKGADKEIKNLKGKNARFFTKGNKKVLNALNGVKKEEALEESLAEIDSKEKPTKDDSNETKTLPSKKASSSEETVVKTVNISSEEEQQINELYAEASEWIKSNSKLEKNKFTSTLSILFNRALAAKRIVRPTDVKRKVPSNSLDLTLKIQGNQVIRGVNETVVDVYITNRTTTPFSVLVEFTPKEMDPKYCPTTKEIFLPARETVFKTFKVLGDADEPIDHVILALSDNCPKEPLLRKFAHLKDKPKISKGKEKACHQLRGQAQSYEDLLEECRPQLRLEKGNYSDNFPDFALKKKAMTYAKFKANEEAKEACKKQAGYVISSILKANKINECKDVGRGRLSCSATTSVACFKPKLKKQTYYKKKLIFDLKSLLEKIGESYRNTLINKPNDINESFTELASLALVQLNRIDYIEELLNEKENSSKKTINCMVKNLLIDFYKESLKSYGCMKEILFNEIPSSAKTTIKPFLNKNFKYPLSLIK